MCQIDAGNGSHYNRRATDFQGITMRITAQIHLT